MTHIKFTLKEKKKVFHQLSKKKESVKSLGC